jgi:hypothetical protein
VEEASTQRVVDGGSAWFSGDLSLSLLRRRWWLDVLGVDTVDLFQRSATYVDRLLRGEKATELAVQAPVRFDLIMNLKTAKALGLDAPPDMLALAVEVIE